MVSPDSPRLAELLTGGSPEWDFELIARSIVVPADLGLTAWHLDCI
jgi:hypothetical protein